MRLSFVKLARASGSSYTMRQCLFPNKFNRGIVHVVHHFPRFFFSVESSASCYRHKRKESVRWMHKWKQIEHNFRCFFFFALMQSLISIQIVYIFQHTKVINNEGHYEKDICTHTSKCTHWTHSSAWFCNIWHVSNTCELDNIFGLICNLLKLCVCVFYRVTHCGGVLRAMEQNEMANPISSHHHPHWWQRFIPMIHSFSSSYLPHKSFS